MGKKDHVPFDVSVYETVTMRYVVMMRAMILVNNFGERTVALTMLIKFYHHKLYSTQQLLGNANTVHLLT